MASSSPIPSSTTKSFRRCYVKALPEGQIQNLEFECGLLPHHPCPKHEVEEFCPWLEPDMEVEDIPRFRFFSKVTVDHRHGGGRLPYTYMYTACDPRTASTYDGRGEFLVIKRL